jgi:hypothetical protein
MAIIPAEEGLVAGRYPRPLAHCRAPWRECSLGQVLIVLKFASSPLHRASPDAERPLQGFLVGRPCGGGELLGGAGEP